MGPGTFVAYYRVSTARQGASGLGLEAQRAVVDQYFNGSDGKVIAEFTEVETGTRTDRPQLVEALKACELYGAKLIIAKLDRLARNVAFISNLMDSSVEFVAVDFPQANRLTIHILAAVAEREREMISQRTKAALAAAKARGTKLGNPNGARALRGRGNTPAITAVKAVADAHTARVLPVIKAIRADGIISLH